MGQYFLIVNPVKRQYLDPHAFGNGLKFLEFSGDAHGVMQGLAVLLADNRGGGGHLETAKLTDAEKDLIGGWVGDPAIIAGDYADPWRFVPEGLRGQNYTYQAEEEVPVPGKPGHTRTTGRMVTRTGTFGKRIRDGVEADHDETLYSAARVFFEDLSDQVIKLVAKAESPYHPWAALDAANGGWRTVPEMGVLPQDPPKKPLAGQRVWKAYQAQAVPYEVRVLNDIQHHLRIHPDQVELFRHAFDRMLLELRASLAQREALRRS